MTNSIIIEFNTGGFYTKSTLIMLNHLLRDSGFMILKGKKMWYLKNNEQYIPFQDYMKIEVNSYNGGNQILLNILNSNVQCIKEY
jgi:hypothetical protein